MTVANTTIHYIEKPPEDVVELYKRLVGEANEKASPAGPQLLAEGDDEVYIDESELEDEDFTEVVEDLEELEDEPDPVDPEMRLLIVDMMEAAMMGDREAFDELFGECIRRKISVRLEEQKWDVAERVLGKSID
jgi:CRISPR/Cas system CMR subunit Cmr4 (Cas7 group RAMP superfamily)